MFFIFSQIYLKKTLFIYLLRKQINKNNGNNNIKIV